MIAKRPLFVGIGIGLILSALVITLFSLGEEDPLPPRNAPMQLDAGKAGNPGDAGSGAPGTGEDQANYANNDAQKSPGQRPNSSDQQDSSNGRNSRQDSAGKAESGDVVVVTVSPGLTAEKIADLLVERGVIGDKAEFLNRVHERRVSTKFQAGTYELRPTRAMDDLIDQLTAGPDDKTN